MMDDDHISSSAEIFDALKAAGIPLPADAIRITLILECNRPAQLVARRLVRRANSQELTEQRNEYRLIRVEDIRRENVNATS